MVSVLNCCAKEKKNRAVSKVSYIIFNKTPELELCLYCGFLSEKMNRSEELKKGEKETIHVHPYHSYYAGQWPKGRRCIQHGTR